MWEPTYCRYMSVCSGHLELQAVPRILNIEYMSHCALTQSQVPTSNTNGTRSPSATCERHVHGTFGTRMGAHASSKPQYQQQSGCHGYQEDECKEVKDGRVPLSMCAWCMSMLLLCTCEPSAPLTATFVLQPRCNTLGFVRPPLIVKEPVLISSTVRGFSVTVSVRFITTPAGILITVSTPANERTASTNSCAV